MRKSMLVIAALFVSGCATGSKAGKVDLQSRLESYLTGDFSNETALAVAERQAIEQHFPIVVSARPIPGLKHTLYLEQAGKAKADKPYRQRVYVIGETDGNTVSLTVCELNDPAKYVNAQKNPAILDTITSDSYKPLTGCDVHLVWDGMEFKGGTTDRDCLNDFGEAAYATSEVRVFDGGYESWDRGYNAKGEQVWGAEKLPYLFSRVK